MNCCFGGFGEIQTLTNLVGAPYSVNSAVSILLEHDFGSERTGIKFDEMSHSGVLGRIWIGKD